MRTGTAIMSPYVVVTRIICEKVIVEPFAFVHTPDGGPGYKHGTFGPAGIPTGRLQGFAQRNNSHQGCTNGYGTFRNTQRRAHLRIAERHFGAGKMGMSRGKIAQWPNSRSVRHQGIQRGRKALAQSGNYTASGNNYSLHNGFYLVRLA